MKWLVYGHKGWIGQKIVKLLEEMGEDVHLGNARVDNEEAVLSELEENPDRVISLTGRTHGPGYSTIDYLEQKGKILDNVRDNLYGPMVLAHLCRKKGIHLTYLGTGCIFNYNETHREDNVVGYTEHDKPNFFGSGYSVVKGFTDRLMHMQADVLNVRIRMPITAEDHPRNFITKITTYEKICSIRNSMTVLPELLPVMIDMASNNHTGTVNLTNPGAITHNEILDMYREFVDPEFTYQNFTLEEQAEILLSERSNNRLDTSLLESMYPNVTNVHDAVKRTLVEMKMRREAETDK